MLNPTKFTHKKTQLRRTISPKLHNITKKGKVQFFLQIYRPQKLGFLPLLQNDTITGLNNLKHNNKFRVPILRLYTNPCEACTKEQKQ